MNRQQFNQLWNEIKQYGRIDDQFATWAGPNVHYMTLVPEGDLETVRGELRVRYPELKFSLGQRICNNIIQDAIVFYVEIDLNH